MIPDTSASRPPIRYLWILLFVLAAGIWSVHIERPVDLPVWHEFDYASISRNFVREGNNILYPRIDWRGNGLGYTEMEFPIIPWTVAQLYRVFGIHEVIGRILSYFFTLLSLITFCRLALKLLPERAALIAAIFFVGGALVTQVATALQPEPLMLLFYLLAIYYFLNWYETRKWRSYALSVATFSCAMLVKSPAAHLAIFFFLWALHQDGKRAFRRVSLYLFAVLSFAPVVIWYTHAASLWHQFHNSMGVANEDHWFGLDLLKRPKVFANLVGMDLLLVCGLGGAIIALATLSTLKVRSSVNVIAGYWCVSILVYFLVIMRTASSYWAAYYHVVLVPPVALLCGLGMFQVQLSKANEWRRGMTAAGSTAIIFDCVFLWLGKKNTGQLPGILAQVLGGSSSFVVLGLLTALSLAVTVLILWLARPLTGQQRPKNHLPFGSATQVLLVPACVTYFLVSGLLVSGLWQTFGTRSQDYRAARCIGQRMSSGTLIVASGGICMDAGGHRLANNAPEMFYWLDDKGFSTCQGHESIPQLRRMAASGAKYFVAEKLSLNEQRGFESDLRRSYPVVADCGSAILFKLNTH